MKIYIASSWKNQHAVEMLTDLLRARGYEVTSFVEKAVEDEGRDNLKWDFDEWVMSEDGREQFEYDVQGAMTADLVVYIGPSGTDAWAEVGAAYGRAVPIYGLWAKGEPAGLMRRMMMAWFTDHCQLLDFLFKLDLYKEAQ